MYKAKSTARNTKYSAWNWPLLLLFFAVFGVSEITSVHNLLHKKESAELHTALNENDPCHVSIYHYERSQGCDHDAHFIDENKCPLCDLRVPNIHFVENTLDAAAVVNYSVFIPNSFEPSVEGILFQFDGRAPPVL